MSEFGLFSSLSLSSAGRGAFKKRGFALLVVGRFLPATGKGVRRVVPDRQMEWVVVWLDFFWQWLTTGLHWHVACDERAERETRVYERREFTRDKRPAQKDPITTSKTESQF